MLSKEKFEEIDNNQVELLSETINILKYLGVWPKQKDDYKFKLQLIILLLFVLLMDFSYAYFVYDYIRRSLILGEIKFNLDDISDTAAGLLGTSFCISYSFCHQKYQKRYALLVKELEDFSVYEKPHNLQSVEDRTRIITVGFIWWLLLSVVGIWGWYISRECDENAVPGTCGFLVPCALPYINVQQFLVKEIFCTVQTVTIFFVAAYTFFYGWLIQLISELLVNRLEHLEVMLLQLPEIPQEMRTEHIWRSIQYHQNIIDVAERLYDATYAYYFAHIPASTIMMTTISYQLLMGLKYIAFAHGCLWLTNISITCFMGDRLRYESGRTTIVAYQSIPWDGDLSTQKDLMMVMIRANKELVIPGGLMGICSHEQFLNLLKITYSFIALIYQQNNE